MKIFIICPVRNITTEWRNELLNYSQYLESAGHDVHLPFRDVEQEDPTGFRICREHAMKIYEADEVHIAYDGKSEGWLFDLGMAFVLDKVIKPIKRYFPDENKGKSYSNMVWEWSRLGLLSFRHSE